MEVELGDKVRGGSMLEMWEVCWKNGGGICNKVRRIIVADIENMVHGYCWAEIRDKGKTNH